MFNLSFFLVEVFKLLEDLFGWDFFFINCVYMKFVFLKINFRRFLFLEEVKLIRFYRLWIIVIVV